MQKTQKLNNYKISHTHTRSARFRQMTAELNAHWTLNALVHKYTQLHLQSLQNSTAAFKDTRIMEIYFQFMVDYNAGPPWISEDTSYEVCTSRDYRLIHTFIAPRGVSLVSFFRPKSKTDFANEPPRFFLGFLLRVERGRRASREEIAKCQQFGNSS